MQTLTTAAYDSAKDPAQPSDPAKNNGGQKGDPAKNNANASGAAKADASAARTGNADTAKTGDESQAGLLATLALLAVAGAGAALTADERIVIENFDFKGKFFWISL